MKRQISILACLLMLLAIVFAVASCTKPEELHVHEYEQSVTKEATCTDKGEITYACECGDTYVNETAAKGHNVVVVDAVAPTCTAEGKTEGRKCQDCGVIIIAQSSVAPLGHKASAPATCTEPQICTRGCGKVFVEALGHKPTDATCTEPSVCTVCTVELADALGHKPTDATCTEPSICTVCLEEQAPALGHVLKYDCFTDLCDRCGMVEVEATTEHEYANECDAHCMKCYELTNEEAAHSLVHVEAKAPTCAALGNIEYWTCEFCGTCWDNENGTGIQLNRMNVIVPMVDHEYFFACDAHCMNCGVPTNPDAAHTITHVEAKAPTCTENGNIEHWLCTDCGTAWGNEELTGVNLSRMDVIVTALGHTYTYECDAHCATCGEFTNEEAAHSLKHVAAKAPTCTETGNKEHWACEFCGTCWDNEAGTGVQFNRLSTIISAAGHKYAVACDPVCLVCQDINTAAAHDAVHVARVEATCTEDGNIEYWYCSYCDLHWINKDCTINTSASSVVIPNLGGHSGYDYDRQCDVCKLYILPEAGEAFKLGMYQGNNKKQLYITGAMSGYYYATTTNIYSSPDVFIENVNGGFYMYFMKGTTKTYLYLQKSGSYNNVKFGSTKAVWTFDQKTGAFITTLSGSQLYLGTYNNFDTVSASYISYITGNNASKVDVSQFILRPEILVPHDCQMSEATCKAASTCSICGKVEGSKLPHTPGAEATCTAAQTCTVCGTTITAKLAHTGGTATCTEKAVCGVCGQSYGNLAAHTGGTATCVDKAVCGVCGQSYGNLGDHNYVDGFCSVCTAKEPDGLVNATLSFASTANRLSQTTSQQVWSANGVTVTNNKAASTSNVANYSNPARFYASSELIIEGKGMTKIVFDCNSASYATTLKTSIGTVSGATVTVSSDKVTVTFTSAVDSFKIAKLSAQVRMDSITVNP